MSFGSQPEGPPVYDHLASCFWACGEAECCGGDLGWDKAAHDGGREGGRERKEEEESFGRCENYTEQATPPKAKFPFYQ